MMSMKGNLEEFDISYIIQIISQEQKTGLLQLKTKGADGYLVFKGGKIIYASSSEENAETMLFKYLEYYKKFSDRELVDLYSQAKKNLRLFCHNLVDKKYLAQNELLLIMAAFFEDIVCSLFIWKKGTYTFTVSEDITEFQIGSITFTFDSVAMEAARRSDEWQRITAEINGDTIFQRKGQADTTASPPLNSPLENPTLYLIRFIDGVSPVELIGEHCFFSKYRLYEALFELKKNDKIYIVTDQVKTKPTAHPKPDGSRAEPAFMHSVLSISLTMILCTVIWLCANVLLKGILLENSVDEGNLLSTAVDYQKIQHQILSSRVYYQMYQRMENDSVSTLIQSSLISNRQAERYHTLRVKLHSASAMIDTTY
ncbi:MAG: DUF4388 domain-containing protein [Chitinivibrionales bacterium]|nr:DUF4388 domain-containing protein [Chitinivibrionales bacterium]